ncbi:hypothetical protein KY312_00035 [Candidatus Woesearchaeota archaeon]|nr:hypothetical protein [Candidatus Woesearchaeota archaeon]
MAWYKFQCLQCGRKYKTDAALAAHQKTFHHRYERKRKRAEHRARRAGGSAKAAPEKGIRQGTNWIALIIFLIVAALFIYFFYLR